LYSKRVNVASSLTGAQGALLLTVRRTRGSRNSIAEVIAGAADGDAETGQTWFESGAS
jgi:hypothetical protein